MKKIVALVLSLVMVLGLATTAFGAPSTVKYDLYNADGTLMTAAATDWVNIESFKADVNKTTGAGNVAYYTMVSELGYPVGDYYVECARADADFYLTLKGNEGVYKYLDEVTVKDYSDSAVQVANIGDECGQFDLDEDDKLYMATDADGVPSFWYGLTGGGTFLLVDGKIVEVASAAGAYVHHDWVVTEYNAKEEPVAAKCDECDATAKLYKTKLAAPAGSVFDVDKVGAYWVVVDKAPAAADTDKVESAQTFDAGIAMYVGMSVMAAAGSAVVLKKKD